MTPKKSMFRRNNNRVKFGGLFLALLVLVTTINSIRNESILVTVTPPGDILELPTRSSTTKITTTSNAYTTTAPPPKKNVTANSCGDKTYNVVVCGNDAYLEDFLTWWYHCEKTGLCCDPRAVENCCSTIITFYAEDEPIFEKLKASKILKVKKSWESGTAFNNFDLTGRGRFTIKKPMRFNHMVSRRPSLLLQELLEAQRTSERNGDKDYQTNMVVYFDLDSFVLQDPRPYFVGDYDFWGHDALKKETGPYNTGMLAMRPTEATINVIRDWKRQLEDQLEKPMKNQPMFNKIVKRHNATVHPKMLPVSKFLAGQPYDKRDTGVGPLAPEVVFFHNNFCGGKCSKVQRAKTLGLWHPVELSAVMG